MKVNYKKFSKHAEKMVKAAKHLEARPILQGINHDAEGNLAVTDSHRLYYAKNVNAPKDVTLHAITGEEIDAGTYPEVTKLLPDQEPKHTYFIGDVPETIKIIKAMIQAGVATGERKNEIQARFNGDELKLVTPKDYEHIFFSYALKSANEQTKEDGEANFNLSYFLDAIEMFHDMGVDFIRVDMHGNYRPFHLKPAEGDDIQAIILPIRRY